MAVITRMTVRTLVLHELKASPVSEEGTYSSQFANRATINDQGETCNCVSHRLGILLHFATSCAILHHRKEPYYLYPLRALDIVFQAK